MLPELNKESLLLMYLADELSATDRAQVSRKLAADPSLRAELERLESTIESFEAGMARLDARALPSESIVVRRIGLAMRQRITEELAAEVTPQRTAARKGVRFPMWAYPIATAAAVVIAFISWWGHRPDGTAKLPAIGLTVAVSPMAEEENKRVATDIEKSFEDTNLTQPETSVASLESAEDQLAELSRSTQDATPSEFGFSDGQ